MIEEVMKEQSKEEEFSHKLSQLTERETAAVLAVLRQYDNTIIVMRNKKFIDMAIRKLHISLDKTLDFLTDIKAHLVPEEDIKWIINDQRVSFWFYHYYSQNIHVSLPPPCQNMINSYIGNVLTSLDCSFYTAPPVLSPGPQNQPNTLSRSNDCMIDKHNFCLIQKSVFINRAKRLYNTIRTKRESTNWLDIDDEDQLYWASDYLDKARILIKPPLFLAQNNIDILAQICASLDTIDNTHQIDFPYVPSINKKYFISNMRKAWSQKKFRDKKDVESAQDLLLTRKAKNQLLELSSAYGISSFEMLTNLIDSAHQDTKN